MSPIERVTPEEQVHEGIMGAGTFYLICSFILSFTEQILIEHSLCAKH